MSARRQPSLLRATTARLAIAGAASLATVLASAPMAMADDEIAPPNSTDDSVISDAGAPTDDTLGDEASTSSAGEVAESGDEASTSSAGAKAVVQAADVVPNYGQQKFRVGFQIADGSYVLDDSAPFTAEFEITTSGGDQDPSSYTCIATMTDPSQLSTCGDAWTQPGKTTTITQTSISNGLARSAEVLTVPPCELGDAFDDIPNCGSTSPLPVTFTNGGSILPETTSDRASTAHHTPVTINVLANDTSDDPNTTLTISSGPRNGTAVVTGKATPPTMSPTAVAAAGTLAIRYTPEAGFSGTDTFTYALTNSNGTTEGTVSVKVAAAPATKDDESTGDDKDTTASYKPVDDRVLPDTGGADPRLLGYAALMLISGGVLTANGRRRTQRNATIR